MLTGLIHIDSNDLANYNMARIKVILLDSNNYEITSLDRLVAGAISRCTSNLIASKFQRNGK